MTENLVDEVPALALSSKDNGQFGRLPAIATILDGGSRSEAAKVASTAGLATRKALGPATILGDPPQERREFAR